MPFIEIWAVIYVIYWANNNVGCGSSTKFSLKSLEGVQNVMAVSIVC
jgi:hypothetical protein